MNSEQLYEVATLYARMRGISLPTLGTYAARDATFFRRLPAGRVTIRRAKHVLQYIYNNWPAGIPWPAGVPRPNPGAGVPASASGTRELVSSETPGRPASNPAGARCRVEGP